MGEEFIFMAALLLASIVGCVCYWITKNILNACFGRNINLSYVDRNGVKHMRRIRVKIGG